MKISQYTVITGASMGLGKALCIECAKRGFNLILIALPNEKLKETAAEIKQSYNVAIEIFEVNLTNSAELEWVTEMINRKFSVNMLINNAGIGGSNEFQKITSNYLDQIILLNIRAMVMLTHRLLPNIRKVKEAYILNIASMAAFSPMPYKTIYPASKAFVYSFSRGLQTELAGSGITVSVAHPGGMATNSDVAKRINRHNKLIKSTILSPEKTAAICIRQLLKKDPLVIPGLMNKISYVYLKCCPVWLQLIIFRYSLRKELNLKHPVYA